MILSKIVCDFIMGMKDWFISIYQAEVICQNTAHLYPFHKPTVAAFCQSTPEVGVTKPISTILSFSIFSRIISTLLTSWISHSYWQVSPQLSCGDTCQISMCFNRPNRYFSKSQNINDKLMNTVLVPPPPPPPTPTPTPHPPPLIRLISTPCIIQAPWLTPNPNHQPQEPTALTAAHTLLIAHTTGKNGWPDIFQKRRAINQADQDPVSITRSWPNSTGKRKDSNKASWIKSYNISYKICP